MDPRERQPAGDQNSWFSLEQLHDLKLQDGTVCWGAAEPVGYAVINI